MFSPAGIRTIKETRSTFSNDLEGNLADSKDMSFATIGEMAGRRKNNYSEDISMIHGGQMGPPPAYKLDREGTLAPHWWDVRGWSKKKMLLVVVGLVILAVVIIIIAVEVSKKNSYPDYSALTYTLTDTCTYHLFLLLKHVLTA